MLLLRPLASSWASSRTHTIHSRRESSRRRSKAPINRAARSPFCQSLFCPTRLPPLCARRRGRRRRRRRRRRRLVRRKLAFACSSSTCSWKRLAGPLPRGARAAKSSRARSCSERWHRLRRLPPQSCVIPRSISESGVHHGMASPACSYSVM